MVRFLVYFPPSAHDTYLFQLDSFPSMIMTYYTEKARKKQARKQRAAGVQSKG